MQVRSFNLFISIFGRKAKQVEQISKIGLYFDSLSNHFKQFKCKALHTTLRIAILTEGHKY